MPVTIHIEGTSAAHAFAEMRTLLGGDPRLRPEPAPVAEEVPAGEEKTFPEPTKATRKRAAKAETVAKDVERPSAELVTQAQGRFAEGNLYGELDGPAEPEAEQPEAPADDTPFTLDDARKALADLLAQPDGKTKAQAVFAELGCAKLSELSEGQYKAFIAAIAKARGL